MLYADNRSFNNLFADCPGLQSPLAQWAKDAYAQRDQAMAARGQVLLGDLTHALDLA